MASFFNTNGYRKKVLLIEDDAFLIDILDRKLTSAGFEFRNASNLTEALESIKNAKPDVILLDIVLPQKSGYDVLESIKERGEAKDIPVIILSNLGDPADQERGRELGAEKFLIKSSISVERIVEEVKEVVSGV